MATGSDSVDDGSDTIMSYECDPCMIQGTHIGATAYCGKCKEYLCQGCEQYHPRLKANRDHILVNVGTLSSMIKRNPPPLIAYCDEHRTELIINFCEDHNMLTCAICNTTSHRKCAKSALADKIKKKIIRHADILVKKMKNIKQRVRDLHSARERDVDLLTEQVAQSVHVVQELKRKINEKVDLLERNAYRAIEEARRAQESLLNDHLKTCENILKQADDIISEMHDCQATTDKETIFIGLTKSHNKVDNFEKIAADVESEAMQYQLTFQPNKATEELIQQMKDFGKTIVTAQNAVCTSSSDTWNILELEVSRQQDIKINSECVSGSTFLDDGDLVLCDNMNKKLYLYSRTFTVKKDLDLPSRPHDVCAVGDKEVAVTLPEQAMIQFVAVKPNLRLKQSLTLELKCYGIDFSDDKMFVACHNETGKGWVLIVTLGGQVVRKLGINNRGRCLFKGPEYVCVSRCSGRVYVSDRDTHAVTCLTQDNDEVYKYTHMDLSLPCGVLVDSEDNMLVCGSRSDNVHRVDTDGNHHSILAGESDGIGFPHCVSYRDKDGALVVGMDDEPVYKVFWLRK